MECIISSDGSALTSGCPLHGQQGILQYHELTFIGLCLAILQSTRQAGPIRVTARAEGLKQSSIEMEAAAPSAAEPALP